MYKFTVNVAPLLQQRTKNNPSASNGTLKVRQFYLKQTVSTEGTDFVECTPRSGQFEPEFAYGPTVGAPLSEKKSTMEFSSMLRCSNLCTICPTESSSRFTTSTKIITFKETSWKK